MLNALLRRRSACSPFQRHCSWPRRAMLHGGWRGEESQYTASLEPNTIDVLNIVRMVHAIRRSGYFCANLDPLQRGEYSWWAHKHAPQLVKLFGDGTKFDLTGFKLDHLDLDTRMYLPTIMLGSTKDDWTLREILHTLKESYCGTIGIEVAHLTDPERRTWMRNKLYTFKTEFTEGSRRRLLRQLMEAHHFEHLLHNKFPSTKRFGAEGCEALIPALHTCLARAARLGVTHVEMGMSHRARLSVLANVFQKPVGALCTQFMGETPSSVLGDVMYHLGTQGQLDYSGQDFPELAPLNISLAPNPSHLEAVNPVVIGRTRWLQQQLGDKERKKVLGILVHGDAAFIGQGITAETLELSDLPDFRTGGTIHVVVNNQIGFTTNPQVSRSSPFPTDMALVVRAPILHVNGDDVEAVARAMQVAVEWRQTYHTDIVVDIVCYRRRGHNELDNPALTQPATTALIKNHPAVYDRYKESLVEQQVISENELHELHTDELRYQELLADELEATLGGAYLMMPPERWQSRDWAEHVKANATDFRPTGVPIDLLQHVAQQISRIPENFELHPEAVALLDKRQLMADGKIGINFGFAELIAIGTLVRRYRSTDWEHETNSRYPSSDWEHKAYSREDHQYFLLKPENEWTHVRLSGQDVERGTFNQRHAILWDQRTGRPYVPLNNITRSAPTPMMEWSNDATGQLEQAEASSPSTSIAQQQKFHVCNSSLSEAAVLGFEYGYSLLNPSDKQGSRLVIWEAQFGDFANGAQVLIDNFIASGESKWLVESNLVLLLPHGNEGQGPDHSSGRVERFLQLVREPVTGGLKMDTSTVEILLSAFHHESNSSTKHPRDAGSNALTTHQMQELLQKLVRAHTEMSTSLLPVGDGWNRESWALISDEISATFVTFGETYATDLYGPTAWLVFCSAYFRRIAERDINMIVVNPTSPANYFHVLRRQVHRSYNKPLIVMSPKFLHHHSPCTSEISEFGLGTYFRRVITDHSRGDNLWKNNPVRQTMPSKIRRIIFCSGKIAYDINRTRKTSKVDDVLLARLEQIAPFPFDRIAQVMMSYPHAEIVWAQEEPKNQGCWHFVNERVTAICEELTNAHKCHPALAEDEYYGWDRKLRYIGREAAAAAASGSMQQHRQEQQKLVLECLK
eukprot:TRINITY_DN26355_c0_g2_i2.p1 TRINITY_DN26355_c0_g2~~TRINITY_DN26355_c0_g2_i2.p1  ORF type:complete len:1143 (-),score=167.53 TRINITY_DN26355_c0_g2_i2:90-3518(-)